MTRFLIRVLGLALIPFMASTGATYAMNDAEIGRAVTGEIGHVLPPDGRVGIAVVVRIDGRTLFFNQGPADVAAGRPVTSDTLFNLGSVAKVFDTALLGQAVVQKELSFDDRIATAMTELKDDADIRNVTFDQLATYTSGFVLPQDHPPWPDETYTLS